MSVESSLVTRLRDTVSDLVVDRIYANVLPAGTEKPAIVYRLISTVPVSALNRDTDVIQARFQLTLIADSQSQRIALSESVRASLQRYQGGIILDSVLENISDQPYDMETDQTARIADFMITYRSN